ncbi:hypothetical protein SEA_DATBOI_3 [Gordonia phage DatBoi]|nr:hypothetical protein SEA_DATBOI_3 [Gordonia phage DatBoi]
MSEYLLGLATLPAIAYIGFGPVLGRNVWREYRNTEHWRHQYASSWIKPPFFTRRRWIVGVLAALSTVGLWPLVAAAGRLSVWNWRRRHNAYALRPRMAAR